jgi:phosphoadenosine phosphosulfate reductase
MSRLAARHKKSRQAHLVPVSVMVDEAIGFICEHEPPEGYFVAFSGGKDSIVTLELVRMSGVKHQAFYSATTIDPPELVKFIRQHYPDVTWLHPKESFWSGIKRKNPPTRWARWCCDILKKNRVVEVDLHHHILGIRAEESAGRRKRGRIDYHQRLKKHNYKPIFDWLEWHIWDFIDACGLPYPSLYDEGWDRIGCVVCPMHCYPNSRQLERDRQRWPEMFKVFEKVVTEWFNAKRLGIDKDFTSAEEYLSEWYRGFTSVRRD